jgi:hypothetical protein
MNTRLRGLALCQHTGIACKWIFHKIEKLPDYQSVLKYLAVRCLIVTSLARVSVESKPVMVKMVCGNGANRSCWVDGSDYGVCMLRKGRCSFDDSV